MNLRDILDKHNAWLRGEPDGVQANLSGADFFGANLSRANLSRANLSRADFFGANLSRADFFGANLSRANLSGANLSGANLSGADFFGANLSGANLSGANLSGANLSVVNLSRADLSRADLSRANLFKADLFRADLFGANLSGANLSGANLSGANLSGALNLNIPLCCPEEGSFIAWKKARDNKIIKLLILETAKRSSACGRKCRANMCTVLAIENTDGTPSDANVARSRYDASFIYTVGETIVINDFDINRYRECAPGIHFFITRQEAVDYTG